jgi:hypothetical protein
MLGQRKSATERLEETAVHFAHPFCSNHRVSATNSLASLYQDVDEEWDYWENGGLTPEKIVATSERKVHWKCAKGPDHKWEATLYHRTKDKEGCPFCDGKKVSITNCLATTLLELAAEWHPEKNGTHTPDNVLPGSARRRLAHSQRS